MKEVRIIFVEVLADAGEPDPGFLVMDAAGNLYKGNGTATPDEITTTLTRSNFANNFLFMGS